MSSTIVWIHGDNLNPHNPALAHHPGAAALFVWDEALLARRQVSLKRIVFIYECLLALPVTIRRGDVATELAAFAMEQGATRIATAGSPSPGFENIAQTLRAAGLQVIIYDEAPFVDLPPDTDLRRFSRYWRVAKERLR